MTQQAWSDCGRGDDPAAYVLGALEPGEADTFALHFAGCTRCAEQVAALQPGVDVLGHGVTPRAIPGEVRERIMRQVRSEAELLNAAGAGADRVAPRRRRWLARGFESPFGSREWGAAAGALALACGIALGVVFSGGDTVTPGRTIQAQVTNLPAGASAEVVRSGGRAELVVAGLPQPPQGRIYQVWLLGASGRPQPTDALFSVSRGGNGRSEVTGDLHGVRRLMVTAEPLGGSTRPTRAPIIIATI